VKALITGATGFVGGHLAEKLVRKGYEVRALARQTSDTSRLKKLDIEIIDGDIRDAGATKKAVRSCEFVYHLAAKTTKDHLSKKEYYAHNVQGTRSIAQAALDEGVNRLVYASSIGVYGTFRDSTIDENTPPNPDSYYRETKLGGEKEILRFHRDGGLPVVVARLASVFGPGSCNWLSVSRKIAKGNFRMIGAGENYEHMVYVEDLVEGVWRCSETQGIEGKTYILAGPEPAKVRQVFVIIAQELGADSSFATLPAAPFRLYQRLCELVHRSFGIELLRSHYYDVFLMDHVFATSRAQDELGYFPRVSLKNGFRRLIRWYREQGYLSRSGIP
jgi:nucleoside-diphosphate-sugar epimerase